MKKLWNTILDALFGKVVPLSFGGIYGVTEDGRYRIITHDGKMGLSPPMGEDSQGRCA